MAKGKGGTLLVYTAPRATFRGRGPQEIAVDALRKGVTEFLGQIKGIFDSAPSDLGSFRFTEFTVSAEVSAGGKLGLLGSGVETSAKGGLTFKFERKP